MRMFQYIVKKAMQEVLQCPICEAQADLKFQGHCGYQESLTYDIYHCGSCFTGFVSPLKASDKIYNLIYRNIDRVPGYRRYLEYAERVLVEKDPLGYLAASEDVYWSIERYFNDKAGKNLKVLEIGSGFGYLTYALAKRGIDVTGIDISEIAVAEARKRYGPCFEHSSVETFAKTKKSAYDVVIFTEVIEHIENIKSFFMAATHLLKPGGDLVLTTPNRTPFPADVLWETEPPPVHLWWLSEQSILTIAAQLKLKAQFMDFHEYNLQEIARFKNYRQPYLAIRNFSPSRLPRFDRKGRASTCGDVLQPKPSPLYRRAASQVLRLLRLKRIISAYREKKRLKFLKTSPIQRPIMCAILQKSRDL